MAELATNHLTTNHLAQTYLGNQLQDPQLAQQLAATPYLEVMLAPSDRAKGRIYAQTTGGQTGEDPEEKTEGETVGIIKDRRWSLAEGDVFQTTGGRLLLIHLQPQTVMVLRITQTPRYTPEHALALIHLGHTLGNHHWPILVESDKIYVQLAGDRAVLESTLQGFQIPGLEIAYELRSPTQYLSFSAHHSPHHSAHHQP
ncbi:MAG: urease accessory protein UreE [Cyanobacteria bacterium P01_A01_bin.105]